MKTLLILILTCVCLSYSLQVHSQPATYLKSCKGCSDIQRKRMAESVLYDGATVLVFDPVLENVSGFRITLGFGDRRDPVRTARATAFPVPVEISQHFKQAIQSRADYVADLERDFGSYSNIPFESLNLSLMVSSSLKAAANTGAKEVPLTAYDFISSSDFRTQTYARLTTNYSTYDRFRIAINGITESIDLNVGGK